MGPLGLRRDRKEEIKTLLRWAREAVLFFCVDTVIYVALGCLLLLRLWGVVFWVHLA